MKLSKPSKSLRWLVPPQARNLSRIEQQVWFILEKCGFEVKYFKEHSFLDKSNTFYFQFPVLEFVADFALSSAKIILEVDGQYWHSGVRKVQDVLRDQKIRQQGWKILRIPESRLSVDLGTHILQLLEL